MFVESVTAQTAGNNMTTPRRDFKIKKVVTGDTWTAFTLRHEMWYPVLENAFYGNWGNGNIMNTLFYLEYFKGIEGISGKV